jgi:hypothetical protein
MWQKKDEIKRKGIENLFNESIAKNLQYMKNINTQVQDALRIPNRHD